MESNLLSKFLKKKLKPLLLAVPVRWKIIGIGILPVVILGVSLNYWVTTGLSDWLSYILTDVRVEAAMAAGSRSVFFVTVLAAFLSVILLWFLAYILNNPLEELKRTAQEVASGKFDTRATVWAKDEIGALATSVNQMIDNFVEIQEDLSQTNRLLAAANQIALAAEQGHEIHDILYLFLENLLDLMELEMGWVYLYDPELQKHHLASWKGVPKELEEALLEEENQWCTCQQNLHKDNLPNQIEILPCQRLEACGYTKLSSAHITIPIAARNIQFGVVILHWGSLKPLDKESTAMLSSFGVQISEIVANAWFQIKLREKEAARQMLLESLVTAQEDERNRLARELHDQAGQTLTNLLIRLKAIENQSEETSTKVQLSTTQTIVSKTIEQIRDLSYRLRPPALDEFGLGAAVSALAEEVLEPANVKVTCHCELENQLSSEVEMILYRIVQEGLTNVVRHAEASQVCIALEQKNHAVHLIIEDNGKGFEPGQISADENNRHLGLISMSERAELIGGSLDMYSALGEGTTLEIQVPLSKTSVIHANE